MKFKSMLGRHALEQLNDVQPVATAPALTDDTGTAVAQVAELNTANEGFVGGLLGFLIGGASWVIPFAAPGAGAAAAMHANQLKADIKKITEAIQKAAIDNGKKAVAEGKLSAEDFKQIERASFGTIFQGALLNTLFGPIYGAIKGSEIEDLQKELKKKCEELDKVLTEAAQTTAKSVKATGKVKPAKEDNEGEDAKAAAAAAAAGEGGEGGAGEEGAATPAAGEGEGGAAATPAEGTTGEGAAPADGAGAPTEGGEGGEGTPATPAEGEGAAAPAEGGAGADDVAAAQAAAAAASQVDASGEPPVTDDTGEAEAEVVETEMEAVDAIVEQTEDVGEDVEKLEAATEALEECAALVGAAAQRGGLDYFAASSVRSHLRTVTKSLKVDELMIPALEDMESPSAKVDAAMNTKDQIIAFIKRIMATIRSGFERLGQWIVETYQRLTNAFSAVEARATKLAEKVEAASMKEGKIESAAVATGMIFSQGAPVAGAEASKALATMIKQATFLNNPRAYTPYVKILEVCEELAKNPEKSEELRGKMAGLFDSWFNEFKKNTAPGNSSVSITENGPQNAAFVMPMFGAKALCVAIPQNAEQLNGMVSAEFSSGSKADSVDALDQATAKKLCAEVADFAKSLREGISASQGGVKEITDGIKKQKEVLLGALDAASRTAVESGDLTESQRKAVMFINKVLFVAPKLPVHVVNRALPRSLNYVLDYVAASIAGKAEAAA